MSVDWLKFGNENPSLQRQPDTKHKHLSTSMLFMWICAHFWMLCYSFIFERKEMLSQCHNRELDFKRRLLFCAFFIVISFNRHPISKLDLHIEITHCRKNQSSHFNCHLCLISTELNGLRSLTKKIVPPHSQFSRFTVPFKLFALSHFNKIFHS